MYATCWLIEHNPVLGLIWLCLCGFSVGIFWPGTLSVAARTLPAGGTAMFAFLALAGDLGCASGPTLVGFAADASNGDLRMGILLAVIFPIAMLAGLLALGNRPPMEEG